MKKAFMKLAPQRRDDILGAVIEIFAEKGFNGAGISDICSRAGISNGALYTYFNNKDDLFRTVLEHGSKLIEGLFAGIEEGLSVQRYFRTVFDRIRHLDVPKRQAVAVYIELGSPSMNRFAGALAFRLERKGSTHIREYLDGARARGGLKPGSDVSAAAFLIDNMIVLYGYSLVSDYHRLRLASFLDIREDESVDEDQLIGFLLDTIKSILLP